MLHFEKTFLVVNFKCQNDQNGLQDNLTAVKRMQKVNKTS